MLVQLPIRGIKTIYGIGGVDHAPYLRGELKDGSYGIPVAFPALHGVGILLSTFGTYLIPCLKSFLLIR